MGFRQAPVAERPVALPPARDKERIMADDSFARDEESWDERLRRISKDTREFVVGTRRLIARSRESLALADESLKRRQRPLIPR